MGSLEGISGNMQRFKETGTEHESEKYMQTKLNLISEHVKRDTSFART